MGSVVDGLDDDKAPRMSAEIVIYERILRLQGSLAYRAGIRRDGIVIGSSKQATCLDECCQLRKNCLVVVMLLLYKADLISWRRTQVVAAKKQYRRFVDWWFRTFACVVSRRMGKVR